MGILIYDFTKELYWVSLLVLAFFTLVGIGMLGIWVRMVILLFRGCLRGTPLISRVLYVTVPLIVGVTFVLGAGRNAWKIADCHLDWFRGNYSQSSGLLEHVTFTEDDEETIEIDFSVSGTTFDCLTSPEQATHFEEGREVTIQYGWLDNAIFIYRIYAAE